MVAIVINLIQFLSVREEVWPLGAFFRGIFSSINGDLWTTTLVFRRLIPRCGWQLLPFLWKIDDSSVHQQMLLIYEHLWKNLHLIFEASDDFAEKPWQGLSEKNDLPSQVRVAPRIENRDPRGAGTRASLHVVFCLRKAWGSPHSFCVCDLCNVLIEPCVFKIEVFMSASR